MDGWFKNSSSPQLYVFRFFFFLLLEMWGRLLFNPLQTVHKSEFCLYGFPLGTIGRLNPSANRGSKLTGSSLWPFLLHFVVCSCWRRRTNAWKWSCPEPRWRWPRPRWRRTRCCTRWKTWESTPARGTSSLLFSSLPSLHLAHWASSGSAHLHPSGPEVETWPSNGRKAKLRPPLPHPPPPLTYTFVEWATMWLWNSK